MIADTAPPGPTAPGPSVFVSYARADRGRIAPLTEVLAAAGHQVWWDALIEGGEAFARSIETALDQADAVIVAWSAHSVASDWVRDEAAHGRDRGRLVPISLDGTAPPLGFRQYHFIDFSRWRGSADAPEIKALLSAIVAARSGRSDALRADPHGAARKQIPRRALLAGAGTAVALAGGGFAAWRLFGTPRAPDGSIAVLPFANLSGDPEQTYFSDGLSEEMRAKLGEAGGFKVAAQTSSNHFRSHEADAPTIGKALGVAWLLDGSVRRAGDTLRISAELIEADSGLSKWSQSFDRQMRDVFAVQSEIALTVIQAVSGQIPVVEARLLKSGTAVVAAYDAYLKGRAQYYTDAGEASDRKALALFDTAIAADPGYAQAHALRADCLLDIASEYASVAQIAALQADALGSARRAVELAPTYAFGWLVLGEEALYARHDFGAARPFFDKARTLGPNDPEVLGQFAYFSAQAGRLTDALAAMEAKIDRDRLNAVLYSGKALLLYFQRRYNEAARQYRQAMAMNPSQSHAQSGLGAALLLQGDLTGARAAYATEPEERQRLAGLAIVDHRLKATTAAQQSFAALQGKFGEASLYLQGLVLAQWGEIDHALDALEKARAANTSGLVWALVEPLLDPLRREPRFKSLLGGMGLN